MRISLLVPCYNEEKTIESSLRSFLAQTRPFDEIVVIDDSSTDSTPALLANFSQQNIIVKRTPQNTGNKSSAQEYGLKFITGDIVVTTDADTLLDSQFVSEIKKSFVNPKVMAVAGHVKSLPYNWLTLCRAFDYVVGQNIHKLAQSYIKHIFVMPGAASAFRIEAFREHISFDHDTITEDLDFTYKLHRKALIINYNSKAISRTQDPATLGNYINQMRRWYGGGWQNLVKHYKMIPERPLRALELSLIYSEGLIFSILLFVIPILNAWFGFWLLAGYFIVMFLFAAWAAWHERRASLLLVPFPYLFILFINAYVYLEQFFKEVILKRKNLIWFKPERLRI